MAPIAAEIYDNRQSRLLIWSLAFVRNVYTYSLYVVHKCITTIATWRCRKLITVCCHVIQFRKLQSFYFDHWKIVILYILRLTYFLELSNSFLTTLDMSNGRDRSERNLQTRILDHCLVISPIQSREIHVFSPADIFIWNNFRVCSSGSTSCAPYWSLFIRELLVTASPRGTVSQSRGWCLIQVQA